MRKKTVNFLRHKKPTIITFIIASFFLLLIADENIFQRFTPRRYCMYNKVDLISLHFVSDLIISISYLVIGYILYKIYRVFNGLKLPWKGFLWMFAGFISMCGITHLIGVLNLWVTFYWIDGLFKLFAAVFSAGVALTLVVDSKSIMEMELDFKMMAEKLTNIIHEAEDKYQQITNAQQEKNELDRNIKRNRGQ